MCRIRIEYSHTIQNNFSRPEHTQEFTFLPFNNSRNISRSQLWPQVTQITTIKWKSYATLASIICDGHISSKHVATHLWQKGSLNAVNSSSTNKINNILRTWKESCMYQNTRTGKRQSRVEPLPTVEHDLAALTHFQWYHISRWSIAYNIEYIKRVLRIP